MRNSVCMLVPLALATWTSFCNGSEHASLSRVGGRRDTADVTIVKSLRSGLPVGKAVAAFSVVKCGGADDGIRNGQRLCYRCKYGRRPVVLVFARLPHDAAEERALARLIAELDKTVAKHGDAKLKCFVNFIGTDQMALYRTAAELGGKDAIKNIPLVVPLEHEHGPAFLRVSPESQITVMLYERIRVRANAAFRPGELTADGVDRILADVEQHLIRPARATIDGRH